MDTVILPIVIGIVRDEAGKLLLGKRHEPETPFVHEKWNFLGGRIEFGESPEETLIREIKEEAGLDVEIIRMIPKVFTKFRTKADGTTRAAARAPAMEFCRSCGCEKQWCV